MFDTERQFLPILVRFRWTHAPQISRALGLFRFLRDRAPVETRSRFVVIGLKLPPRCRLSQALQNLPIPIPDLPILPCREPSPRSSIRRVLECPLSTRWARRRPRGFGWRSKDSVYSIAGSGLPGLKGVGKTDIKLTVYSQASDLVLASVDDVGASRDPVAVVKAPASGYLRVEVEVGKSGMTRFPWWCTGCCQLDTGSANLLRATVNANFHTELHAGWLMLPLLSGQATLCVACEMQYGIQTVRRDTQTGVLVLPWE